MRGSSPWQQQWLAPDILERLVVVNEPEPIPVVGTEAAARSVAAPLPQPLRVGKVNGSLACSVDAMTAA
jgi:hypothetical protein